MSHLAFGSSTMTVGNAPIGPNASVYSHAQIQQAQQNQQAPRSPVGMGGIVVGGTPGRSVGQVQQMQPQLSAPQPVQQAQPQPQGAPRAFQLPGAPEGGLSPDAALATAAQHLQQQGLQAIPRGCVIHRCGSQMPNVDDLWCEAHVQCGPAIFALALKATIDAMGQGLPWQVAALKQVA